MPPQFPDEDLNILYIEYDYDDWDDEEDDPFLEFPDEIGQEDE